MVQVDPGILAETENDESLCSNTAKPQFALETTWSMWFVMRYMTPVASVGRGLFPGSGEVRRIVARGDAKEYDEEMRTAQLA